MDDSNAIESALVVQVPAAEPVVGRLRELYDPAAGWGVPAHITVLYPFMPPAEINDKVLAELQELVGSFDGFDFSLDRVDQFDTDVLFVRPNPADRFVALTAAVAAAWPQHQPYEGVHDEVVPHLTVAHTGKGASFDAIRARVRSELPIHTRAESLDLMVGSYAPNSWHTKTTFDLG